MIPRHQTFLFALLLVASLAMGIVLWQLRDRAHQRLVEGQDSAPTQAPDIALSEEATLQVASDADSSLLTQLRSLPLPQDPGSRARAVLNKLLEIYAMPDAAHPVPGGANSVVEVFLLPVTGTAITAAPTQSVRVADSATKAPETGPQLAVVNLSSSFVANHPAGLETEALTVLSICGTLHANLPTVTQVRFLVDGQQRSTLAGHADLTRTYLTTEAAPASVARP